jgi:hypothetical protein
MHPVQLDDGEVALLKQAKESMDWTILPTFKLKYLYQRLIALPSGRMDQVKQIAKKAHDAIYLGLD